jgi:hypothetical protein
LWLLLFIGKGLTVLYVVSLLGGGLGITAVTTPFHKIVFLALYEKGGLFILNGEFRMEKVTVYIKPHELHQYVHGFRVFGWSTPCKDFSLRLRVPKKNVWRTDSHPDGSLVYCLKQRKEASLGRKGP